MYWHFLGYSGKCAFSQNIKKTILEYLQTMCKLEKWRKKNRNAALHSEYRFYKKHHRHFGSQPTSGGPPAAVQYFNRVQQQLRMSCHIAVWAGQRQRLRRRRNRATRADGPTDCFALKSGQIFGWVRLSLRPAFISAARVPDTTNNKGKRSREERAGGVLRASEITLRGVGAIIWR